jgi:hypothetical protein
MYPDFNFNDPGISEGLFFFGGMALAVLFLFIIILLPLLILMIISWWKIFEKAGKPGWAAVIPFYNTVVMLQIANLQMWLLVLLGVFLIFDGFIASIAGMIFFGLISVQLAKAFKKETIFAVGLFFLPFIFYPILAFSKDQYHEVEKLF